MKTSSLVKRRDSARALAEHDAIGAQVLLASEGWEWLLGKLEHRRDVLERQLVQGNIDPGEYASMVQRRKTICAVIDLPRSYIVRNDKLQNEGNESEQTRKGTSG